MARTGPGRPRMWPEVVIATPYTRRAAYFQAELTIAAIVLWLR
ncbi:hypothetical protein AB0M34_22845 [Nocardia sp. NPDC050193]